MFGREVRVDDEAMVRVFESECGVADQLKLHRAIRALRGVLTH